MKSLRSALIISCVFVIPLAGRLAAAAEGRAVVEVAFQQGVRDYSGCELRQKWGPEKRKSFDLTEGITVRFTGLSLEGEDVRVESARLEMSFNGEGWSRIPTAKLEVHDASAPGAALASLEYRRRKIEGMDPETRFVSWRLPGSLVKRWMENPKSNKGLGFKIIPGRQDRFNFAFKGVGYEAPSFRPRLVVEYSFTGNAAPFMPDLATNVNGKTFGPRFTVEWKKKRWDPNGTAVAYEVEIGADGGNYRKVAEADAAACRVEIDSSKLDISRAYRLRVRARDPEGLSGPWAAAKGAFRVTRKDYVVWTQTPVKKVGREALPPKGRVSASVAAARNEYESFQVVVTGLSDIKGVDVAASDLTGPGGAVIPKSAFTLYRVHYVDCKGKGWLPDSMVPYVDPYTQERIGGKYGAPFEVKAGTNASTWVELHVPASARPGEYRGKIAVSIGGAVKEEVPVSLTVWPVTLAKETSLLTFMELAWSHWKPETPLHPKRAYLHSLHEHRMDVWRFQDMGHGLKRVDGKPVVEWNEEYDRQIAKYFDGSMFTDGVPGKTYLFGVESWKAYKALRGGTDDDRIAILKQYEEHYKDKPFVKGLAWFLIDEPNPKTIKKCIHFGKLIKEHCPSIKNLLTTRYHKELSGLVDIWDPIINVEVIDWNAPGPDAYRNEMKQGRMAINCITVVSVPPTSPNIFISKGTGMNTRIWTWVTFALDQQGIEFWNTAPGNSVTSPKKFGQLWGDGSLFYRGWPRDLGTKEEIALPSIRLKILRDGIEDFELLNMLRKKDPKLAKKMCWKMCQETRSYDKSFAQPVQHMSWNWNTDGKGDRQMPGFIVWEKSYDRLVETRAEIAGHLADSPGAK